MIERLPWAARSCRKTIGITFASALAILTFATRATAESEFIGGHGMPYAAFDRLNKADIEVEGGVIHLGIAPGRLALSREAIADWVRRSAKAVTTFYGHFPVKSARLLIVPVDGPRVQGGTSWGYRGGAIRVMLGSDANDDDLRRDWIMTHEMVHLALPDVEQRYAWLSEGLAVYIEPIARVRSGELPVKSVWATMMHDMPKGLPSTGSGGLDNDSSWANKYWGGALFCLIADVEIRKRTGNRMGLREAMRGVLAAGGNHESAWSIERIISVGDSATGSDVLARLHNDMGSKPVRPDLDRLWRDLGLRIGEDSVEFDDGAPLAAIREAIMN